jgi:hypothetical protein
MKQAEDNASEKMELCKEDILETQKSIEIAKLEKECFSCPACNTRVRFLNNILIKVDIKGVFTSNLDDLNQRLKKLLARRNELQATIEEDKKRQVMYAQIQDLDKELKELLEEDMSLEECEVNLIGWNIKSQATRGRLKRLT